jgi:cytochrome oxidase Cu insertion factor (SCO1/SenC/PrrC family)
MRPLHSRMIMLAIAAMFLLPLTLAWMMYTGTLNFEPDHTRNLGRLVAPAVPLDWSGVAVAGGESPAAELQGFWIILYDLPASCTTACLEIASGLRQVHIAAGLNRDRIKIVLLQADPSLSLARQLMEIYQRFILVGRPRPDFSAALRQAAKNAAAEQNMPALYLVDPLANIMMTYNGKDSPNRINKDLTRLLTWSKLDKRP